MKALVYTGPSTVELLDVDEPTAAPGEVVLDVRAAGICGSELHGVRSPGFRVPPLVMGHEFAGVTADGERRVVVNPIVACGGCDLCARGSRQLCRNRCIVGIHRAGGFGERVAVPETLLHELPDDVGWEQAALIEPLANGVHAWRLVEDLKPARVGIIGAGAIGLLCLVAARAGGAGEVYVADLSADRRKVATLLGADDTGSRLDGEFDVVFDAVGSPGTHRASVELLRPGGRAVWLGLLSDDAGMSSLDLVRMEKSVVGSFAYTPGDFADAVEMARWAPLDWATSAPLSEAAEVFRGLMAGRTDVVKVVLRPSDGDGRIRE